MEIYTLNVGQGNFNVIVGTNEAFIVDTYIPLTGTQKIINVKGALANILAGKELVGLILTGFDADHFNEVGLRIVLNKYLPNWIMYPKYFKETNNASTCFKIIDEFDKNKKINRYSISLTDNKSRFYNSLSKEFYFEVFSPHAGDMSSSNNCSLVCKVVETKSKLSYLITGDTEVERWSNILKTFGKDLTSTVMAAPHHGSKTGMILDLLLNVNPYKVIVSAGVDNQYGHPHTEATTLFTKHCKEWFGTHSKPDGQSLRTVLEKGKDPKTYLFTI